MGGADRAQSGPGEPGKSEDGGKGLGLEERGELIEAPEEEAKPIKGPRAQCMPMQAEIDRHRITHLPYRSWCPECVEGFAREGAHKH